MHKQLFHRMISLNFDENSEYDIFAMRYSRLLFRLFLILALSLSLSIMALLRLLLFRFAFWINSFHRVFITYSILTFLWTAARARCIAFEAEWKNLFLYHEKARTSCYLILFNAVIKVCFMTTNRLLVFIFNKVFTVAGCWFFLDRLLS